LSENGAQIAKIVERVSKTMKMAPVGQQIQHECERVSKTMKMAPVGQQIKHECERSTRRGNDSEKPKVTVRGQNVADATITRRKTRLFVSRCDFKRQICAAV
jgi:hypothetical protein